MLNFDEEIKKFHPILGIDNMEDKITAEDMDDLLDLVKQVSTKKHSSYMNKDFMDKEL